MPPYERLGAYGAPRRSPWRRWVAAALPWIFVACVAAVTMLPVRDWVRRALPSSADTQAARDAEMIWKQGRNSSTRYFVDVIRTVDGETFQARGDLRPGRGPIPRV